MENNNLKADQRIRVMQIIVAALVMGALSFLAVAVLIRESGNFPPRQPEMLSYYVGIPYGIALLVAHFVVPSRIGAAQGRLARNRAMANPSARQVESSANPGQWYGIYQTRLIVGAALLEAGAFYFLIAYLVEGTAFSLAAGACFIAGIAMKFPTRERVERWVERQAQLQEEMTL
jgi:hypothetical protein